MNKSQELDYKTQKERIFRLRVGEAEICFRKVIEPFRDRFRIFPEPNEDTRSEGIFQGEYQYFYGNFTGQEIEMLKLLTHASNWPGGMGIDVLPVYKISNLTMPEAIEETISCIQRYKEVKFVASLPMSAQAGNHTEIIYNLSVFVLDEISSEEKLLNAIRGEYYFLPRDRYYNGFDYFPKIKDTLESDF